MVKDYKKVSILIAAYNEENSIFQIIEKIQNIQIPVDKEIIIVDDGSTDATRKIINNNILPKYGNVRYFEHGENIGKGAAIRTALRHSTGDIILIQDADLEYSPDDYPALLKPILEGKSKVVYGSRDLYRRLYGRTRSASWLFKTGGYIVTWLFNIIYRSDLTDEPTCYKVFDSEVIKRIKLDCKKFEFCPEVSGKLLRLGYQINEVPIQYEPRSLEEGKKIGIRDGLQALYVMLKYRLKHKDSFIKDSKSDLDGIVPEYFSSNPIVKRLFIDRLYYALKFSNINSDLRVLDAGTGNGILLKMLSLRHQGIRLVGLDMNSQISMLKIAGTAFVVGDVRKNPFRPNTFDVIFCLDVLEHVYELNEAINELKRVLFKGGRLIVSVPQETFLYKCGRFLLKGTFSQEKGPCSSPHFWNAKQLIEEINKNFVLREKKALYWPFTFFQILSYDNTKHETRTV